MRLFSYKNRPVHLGPYPLERLQRQPDLPPLHGVPHTQALAYSAPDPLSIAHAMQRYATMFDVVRDGAVAALPAEIPADPLQRAQHLKAAGTYFDASMMGVAEIPAQAWLPQPIHNPHMAAMADELQHNQPQSFAAGMDMILADVLDSARAQRGPVQHHSHVLVVLVEYPRDPGAAGGTEPGTEWITGTQAQRAALLAAQTAVLLASYLRLLGFEARSHTASCTELCLNRAAVAAGLVHTDLHSPYLGQRYGLAAVTTTCQLAPDQALAPPAQQRRSHGLAWQLGWG